MRIKLVAPNGFVYTDGVHYGSVIKLAEGKNELDYHLISEEQYLEILRKEEEKYL